MYIGISNHFFCKLLYLQILCRPRLCFLYRTVCGHIFNMKIVHEVQETKKSAKRCKVLVCAQANNEIFNVTESKVI